ncbi:MAG: HAD-IC family P-type ATPase [Chloroflexi bacterium]|nr:HAD-IC family P-type ATPase [Chloroflexota bacterium]
MADGEHAWHALTAEAALAAQEVSQDRGLTATQVADRQARYGPNAFDAVPPEPRWRVFLRQYTDAMQVVLLVAGLVCLVLPGQLMTGVLLIGLTLLNAWMGMHQEGKASASVAALQGMLVVKARVTRDGQLVELPIEQLVPGDIVSVEAGDRVPADGRVLRAATLEIDESPLTGESLPVPKQVEAVAEDAPLGDRVDLVFMNTQVTRGSGTFLVIATGMATEVGHISGMLQTTRTESTPLTQQLDRLTNQILVVAGVSLAASIGIGLWRGQELQSLFLTAVAFAVSAIPTGLPATITTVLAYGTSWLARSGAIVKRLRSVETLGSTSAINSDKTGTLTLNQMTAVRMTVIGRRYAISGTGYGMDGRIDHVAGEAPILLDPFLLPMVLCADAVVQDGRLVGDPTEGALVVLAAKGGVDPTLTRERYPRVAELPFDAAYKLMATFHRMTDDAGAEVIRCYVKGAPDQLLARSTHVRGADGTAVPVDQLRDAYLAENEALGRQGLRVMATASRDLDPATFDASGDLLGLIEGLTLLAMVGIVDPPRPEARDAIARAHAAGIRVRMITGDHAVTAEAIARELGIEGRAITGAELRAMSDAEAAAAIGDIGVIARVAPEDKVHLVDILRGQGHIVAMTGDGVNDAPALKRADIGVAMGITGTEVSKEAATMILTDDDFSTIVKAVAVGRVIYDNLLRYIRFQMGVLFGFIGTFLGAAVLNIAGGVPFLPLQTLWVNFTTDVFQAIGLGYGAPRAGLMEEPPRPRDRPILSRDRLVWLIIVGAIMAIGTLGVIWWATDQYGDAVGRTMGLTAFSLSNLLFSLVTRDEGRSVFSGHLLTDGMLLKTTGLSILAIILATELGVLQRLLGTVSLDASQWVVCLVAGAAVVLAAEVRRLIGGAPSETPADPGAEAHPATTAA